MLERPEEVAGGVDVTNGAIFDVAVTWAEPLIKLGRLVVMVAVEEVFGATPLTVTKPVLDIATLPFAVAVPTWVKAPLKLVI